MSLLRKQQSEEAGRITDQAYETLRDRFKTKLNSYPSVRRRVAELIDAYDNANMVAVTVQEIVERDGATFSPMSLTLARVGELIQGTRMAEEAWEYERWFRTLDLGTDLHSEVERWLAVWRDADRAGERDVSSRAMAELSKLKSESGGNGDNDQPIGTIKL